MELEETGPAWGPRPEEEAYRQAFDLFLAGTDEKTFAHAYLDEVVRRLPARRVFLDIGPADGTTTRHLSPGFERTICIEPSAPMRRALRDSCPGALVLAEPVMEAQPDSAADLVLLSHVLYYVPRPTWTATVQRIMEWVEPGGLLLMLLQSPDNACMRMVRHFTGSRFDLRELADELAAAGTGTAGAMTLETLPACYRSTDLDETVAVAAFLLSVPADLSRAPLPPHDAIESYVRRHFADPAGGFSIPHEQHVLRIRRTRR
ncbi:class I SAM-dependent methyltransferase [Streptomyces sp. NPDC018031]|uniref:class I SAM-dependent methyltransferase n=1 Tax=Streptomyces sp. NPDC018031 TaxID=3365033 RepID=UPI00379967EB